MRLSHCKHSIKKSPKNLIELTWHDIKWLAGHILLLLQLITTPVAPPPPPLRYTFAPSLSRSRLRDTRVREIEKARILKTKTGGNWGKKGLSPLRFPATALFFPDHALIFWRTYIHLSVHSPLSESLEPAPLLSINGGEVKVMHACHSHFCNMYLLTILLTCWKKKKTSYINFSPTENWQTKECSPRDFT